LFVHIPPSESTMFKDLEGGEKGGKTSLRGIVADMVVERDRLGRSKKDHVPARALDCQPLEGKK